VAYYRANREEVLAKCRAYRAANPEKIKARDVAYRAANAEAVRAGKAEYRAANVDKIRARDAAYYVNNRETHSAYTKAYRLLHTLVEFEISKEEYEAELLRQDHTCPICGEVYVFNATSGCPLTPCIEHSHTRESRLGAHASLRGIVCSRCNRTRVKWADEYLKKLGILDTDPEAFPALMKRKVSFAEQVAKHVTGAWQCGSKSV
jgi:hypothetical protein